MGVGLSSIKMTLAVAEVRQNWNQIITSIHEFALLQQEISI